MIYITQLVFIKNGEEASFDEFESIAMPLIFKYEGDLMLRVRLADVSKLEGSMEKPYEIHLVSFPSETHFEDFMRDEHRKSFLHLKEKAIRSVILIKGSKIGS